MSVAIYYSYLLPPPTNALTLYMWSSSMAGFSKRITGCYLTSTSRSSLFIQKGETNIFHAAKPESNFCLFHTAAFVPVELLLVFMSRCLMFCK